MAAPFNSSLNIWVCLKMGDASKMAMSSETYCAKPVPFKGTDGCCSQQAFCSQPENTAMEVHFLESAEMLTTLDPDDFDGKIARKVKQTLAAHLGVSRFWQRLFAEDDFREIQDDEVFGSSPMKVQLVMLEFLPPDAEEDKTHFCMPEKQVTPHGIVSSRSSKSEPERSAFATILRSQKW